MSVETDDGGRGDGASGRFSRVLAAVRTGGRGRRWLVTAGAVALGLVLATGHWMGLVLGGAFVGVLQRDLKRAVVVGLFFGLLALGAFTLVAPRLEAGELLVLTPAAYVTLGAGLGLPLLGSLTRGVV
ncbi:MAG: hypothetical protein V5A30_05035 [Haloarculaceae archaeon]